MDCSSERYCEPRPIGEILEDILNELKVINQRDDDRVVPIAEAARIASKTPNTIKNWVARGYLNVYPCGSKKGFKVSEIKRVVGL